MKCIVFLLIAFIITIATHVPVSAQPLECTYSSSDQWGSGWCDLFPPMNLAEGVCLDLKIGGSANMILIRVLREGEDPNQSVGLIGEPIKLPDDREVTVNLRKTYSNVVQISVHGGPNPFRISLGSNNGPAKLQLVEHVNCPSSVSP